MALNDGSALTSPVISLTRLHDHVFFLDLQNDVVITLASSIFVGGKAEAVLGAQFIGDTGVGVAD